MTAYVILLVVSGALGFVLCERNPSKKKDYAYMIIVTAMMCVMAALRSGSVGVDYEWVYRGYFETVCQNNNLGFVFSSANVYRSEFIYTLLNMAIAAVSHNPLAMWGAVSVVIIVLRSVFIAKHSSKMWLSTFLYISLGFFTYAMCTLRQELGISVAMFALPYLQKRKPIPYFAIMLIAGLCHNSLLILLPLYFVVMLPPTNKWVIALYSAGMLSIILFSEKMLALFTSTFTRFGFYAPGNYYLKGRNVSTVFMWIVIMIVCALFYKRLIKRSQENLPLFNLCLFGALIMSLTVKHFVFQRVALMLLPYLIILIPEIVVSLAPTLDIAAINASTSNVQQRLKLKQTMLDDKRMFYSIMCLFLFIAVLEYFFLLHANRLLLVPYIPFWK